jgi:hypothetical protein
MKKQTRSILEEINGMPIRRDKCQIIESSGSQVIGAAINLLRLINETYDEDVAADLTKRLISSIRNNDPKKFTRGISRINENKRHPRRKSPEKKSTDSETKEE